VDARKTTLLVQIKSNMRIDSCVSIVAVHESACTASKAICSILIGVAPFFYYRWRYRSRFPAAEYPV
jgi:hypothetical protein